MQNKKIILFFNVLTIITFILFLILPVINKYVPVLKIVKNNEKRKLSKLPKLSFSKLNKFPEKFDKYYKDNLSLRNNFIQVYNLLIFKVFNISPYPDKVMVGKNNWLFYTNKHMLDEYRNTIPFTNKELKLIAGNLVERKMWLEKQGIKYYILIPPNKHTVYPEYYPKSIKKMNDSSRLDGLLEYLGKETDIRVIDLREDFIDFKKTSEIRLYRKTDTHWSKYGAFLGYRKLIGRIKNDFSEIKPLEISDFNVKYKESFGGDLTNMIALKKKIRVKKIKLFKKEKNKSFFKNEIILKNKFPKIKLLRKKQENNLLPKAVVFRDSFGGHFIPFLSENFKNILYVSDHYFNSDIIKYEKPDIVIREVVERLTHILKYKNPKLVAESK